MFVDPGQADLAVKVPLNLTGIKWLAAVDVDAYPIALGEGVDGYVTLVNDNEACPPRIGGVASYHNWACEYLHPNPSGKLVENKVNQLPCNRLAHYAIKHKVKADHTPAGCEK